MSRLIATWFYVGRIPFAPGTWGSLFAIPFALTMLMAKIGPMGFAIATVIVFFIGWAVTAQLTKGRDNHDPSEIVIDEVVGQWVALFPLFFVNFGVSQNLGPLFLLIFLGFTLFRLFDIWKPWPVSVFDNRTDAYGVMMDDVVAGAIAALILTGIWMVFGKTMGFCAPFFASCL